jgi:hypothetical protein
MRTVSRLSIASTAAILLLIGSKTSSAGLFNFLKPNNTGSNYHVTAYHPTDPSAVRVKVSLSKQNIYVMEHDRCLMAVACSVGLANKPTPRGHFTIYSKQEHKRSGSYGFAVRGNTVVPCSGNCGGHYVGYPMGFWCEFAPGYGFHQGFVHPVPRTHGCIRLHGEAAPKFYALVRVGTPVDINLTQPEDATLGPQVQRIDDSKLPDPDPRFMISDAAFERPNGQLLQ